MESTKSIFIFIAIMTGLVAVGLTGLRQSTKTIAETNEEVFNKRAILKSVQDYLDKSVADYGDEEVLDIFDSNIKQYVLDMEGNVLEEGENEDGEGVADEIDMAKESKKSEEERQLPLYVYNNDKGTFYILSVRGRGLWDAIWGTVALKEDLVTVAGASFDHAGETPGLGAEIKDNPAFSAQFSDKKIYAYNGEYTAVIVRKGGARNPEYEVDGISGATVTADGVTEMLQRGIKYYEPYLETLRPKNALGMK
ncbi:MAG: NADH:ubiquinone reductase (Na(+)-transporting) subunit C [Bacteroidota bacterium]